MSESFTTSDQIARDMKMGVFPKLSDRTKHELAERSRIFELVLGCLADCGYGHRKHLAHTIALKLVPTAPPPDPEHNGGDVW